MLPVLYRGSVATSGARPESAAPRAARFEESLAVPKTPHHFVEVYEVVRMLIRIFDCGFHLVRLLAFQLDHVFVVVERLVFVNRAHALYPTSANASRSQAGRAAGGVPEEDDFDAIGRHAIEHVIADTL